MFLQALVAADAAVGIAWHNFVRWEPADGGPPHVTTELVHGAQEITDPVSVAVYEGLWGRLRDVAVVGDAAIELIRGAKQGTESCPAPSK